jgi:hypothetical protein
MPAVQSVRVSIDLPPFHPMTIDDPLSKFVSYSIKVGAERTAKLCLSTPPSEPAVQVSLQRALQGLATSRFRFRRSR